MPVYCGSSSVFTEQLKRSRGFLPTSPVAIGTSRAWRPRISKLSGQTDKLPGEFELIARLCAGIRVGSRTVLGPGDDAAILAPSRGPILLTVDSMVEGVHFELQWGSAETLGARALAVNLSDIAAMGGTPTACVVNLAVREGLAARTLDRIYAGLRKAARETGVDIVGGNVTRASQLAITITLLGEARSGVMRRDGARVGDEIFVTGTLGDAALGWRLLAGKLKARGRSRAYLIDRFLRPEPRLEAARRLAALKPVPAAIDISDGLLQDLGHVLERSRVGAEIDAARVLVSDPYRVVMKDDLSHALGGGEDYELLFCLRPGRRESELSRRLQVPVKCIGRIVRGRGLKVIGANPAQIPGWDQLRAPQ